jgi:hypothetical protein
MKAVLCVLISLLSLASIAQEVDRIAINGKIIVSTEDKEGVAVFNSSANRGTITDKDGYFSIEVALNDVIEFSALQFQDFTVTINQDILRSKRLTVILVEEVNKLDEVVLLPFDLTGNLNADLDNVRTYNVSLDYVYFGLDHITDFEFSADYKTNVENTAFDEYNPRVENMLNIINLTGFLLKQVADIDINKKQDKEEKLLKKTPFKKALEKYSYNFIHTNFDIPLDQVDAFIDYMEIKGVDERLLEKDKEIELLERISQLSSEFLNTSSDKN